MITDYRGVSKYFKFSLVPSPLVSVLGATDTKGLLESLFPTVSYETWVSPDNHTGFFQAPDFSFQSYHSGQYITWNNVIMGNAWISYTLPDGSLTRVPLYFNTPVMN